MSMHTVELKGIIELKTGLHIGAGNDEIHIGGIDNSVVKDRDGYPYIPGSSLKGKIRSLLELRDDVFIKTQKGEGIPSTTKDSPNSLIPRIFGDTSGSNITRVIFRDAFLTEESKKILEEKSLMATEAKSENSIDRVKGVASNPRVMERAISGLEFAYEIVLRVFDNDSEDDFKKTIIDGMRMLEKDALGGSGSRGYGKIVFKNNTWNGKEIEI